MLASSPEIIQILTADQKVKLAQLEANRRHTSSENTSASARGLAISVETGITRLY